jgi:hypothetical protein
MKKIAALVFFGVVAGASAHAVPKYAEADAWRRDLRAAVDAGSNAFLKPEQRPLHGRRLSELNARAEKLFGGPLDEQFGACVKAASAYQSAWQSQVTNLDRPNVAALNGQTRMAFEAGAEYGACRVAVDALELKKK